jgi:DNA-binding MarR family transcriptional regulator
VGTPDNELAATVLHKFLLIYRHLRQHHRHMDSYGIRPRLASVLRFLTERESATVSDIQAYLYTSPSTASNVISQLEDAGYVTRTRDQDDNRVVLVAITPAGTDIASRVPVGGIGLLRQRLCTLPDNRLRQIDAALADLMALMEVTE